MAQPSSGSVRGKVRVKLLVRIIPEDVYIRDVEAPTPSRANLLLEGEKKLLQVVDDPENVSIGVLANDIKSTFQRINYDPLGDIKYLKDGSVDADLDPQMSVYDAFVDAGKAATVHEDQTATIKIIREIRGQPIGVRQGSVVPDLSNPRFQPRRPPPAVPRFSDTNQNLGKRSRDDAFRGETSSRDESQGSKPARWRRLHVLDEDDREDRPVLSIERDVHQPPRDASSRRQGSPMVIPETQDSHVRPGTNTQHDGSEILGDDEPKSESPELNNSIHSLPTAQRNNDDTEMLETEPPTQDLATRSRISKDVQGQSQVAPDREPTSRSSSNYYSPTSGSFYSVTQGRVARNESGSKSTADTSAQNRADPTPSFTRAKLNLVQDGNAENSPITPASNTSRDRRLKDAEQGPNHAITKAACPPSRTSSFSYKFRRDDRVHSVESEIDDSQMSPRSRNSLKRSRNTNFSQEAPKDVSIGELSGLFHRVDDDQPLIQERKRQRKETKWDENGHMDRLSESEEENMGPEKHQNQDGVQHPATEGEISDSYSSEAVAGRRSRSDASSDATNKESNASTERPVLFESLKSLSVFQPALDRGLSHESVSDIIGGNCSDKENETQERTINPGSLPVDVHQNVDMKTQPATRERETEHVGSDEESAVKGTNYSVVSILNDVKSTKTGTPAGAVEGKAKDLPSGIPQHLKSSSNLAGQSPKKSRSKKKSRVEGEEQTPQPESQDSKGGSALRFTTNKAAIEVSSSAGNSKRGNGAFLLSEPDEQLSQDLQASARTGSKKTMPLVKNGKESARKQSQRTKAVAENAAVRHTAESSNKTRKVSDAMGQRSPGAAQGSQKFVDITKEGSFDSSVEEVEITNGMPAKPASQEKSQDGKLGLGFSQSPPSKKKAVLQLEILDDKAQTEFPDSLPQAREDDSFLKKSKSFDKIKSSQSWTADTPSRSLQPGTMLHSSNQQTSVDIPQTKSIVPDSHNNAQISGATQTTASVSESESESASHEDSSTGPGRKTSNANQKHVKNGTKGASTGTPISNAEVASDSPSSKSRVVLPPPKAASKVREPNSGGPIIIPKGNNVYSVNGTSVIVPPGFTVDAYLAMRADLIINPPKSNPKNRIRSSGKSATPTLNQKGSSASPVPTLVKTAQQKTVTKDIEKHPIIATKEKDLPKASTAPTTVKRNSKKAASISTKNPDGPSVGLSGNKAQGVEVKTVAKNQPSTKASAPAKNRPFGETSTDSKTLVPPPAKPIPLSKSLPAKKPDLLDDYIAQREAERAKKAAASSSKTSGITTPSLANSRNIFGGEDSDSESETESATSSDGNVAASKKTKATQNKMVGTGIATVDLSIRDQSPSSGEEVESD